MRLLLCCALSLITLACGESPPCAGFKPTSSTAVLDGGLLPDGGFDQAACLQACPPAHSCAFQSIDGGNAIVTCTTVCFG